VIAEYLDRIYLETPSVFLSNTLGLQGAFIGKETIRSALAFRRATILDLPSEAHFRRTEGSDSRVEKS